VPLAARRDDQVARLRVEDLARENGADTAFQHEAVLVLAAMTVQRRRQIARRAGVNRLTVYNHFPGEGELLSACQAHFLAAHPLPDFGGALALKDPAARVHAVLRALYDSYRVREPMTAKVLRDRAALPALDALLERTMDTQQAARAKGLADGFRVSGRRRERLRAVLRLALDFWTWQRLEREGLDDEAAAELMAALIVAATSASASPRPRD
jgi:AcrR family transcriptional regulator